MRLGLILLGLLGAASAIGSLFSLKYFFETKAFRLLLLLLLANMTLCAIGQLQGFLQGFTQKGRQQRETNGVFLRKAALLVLHTGIVIILIGGLVNSLLGFREQVPLLQGATADLKVEKSAVSCFLKLNDFWIEYNPDGSAAQFYADISLAFGSEKAIQETISINHPLKYKGLKIYLMQYIHVINVQGQADSGWQKTELLGDGEIFEFLDSAKTIEIVSYLPNYDQEYGNKTKTLRPDNPRVLYKIHQEGNPSKLMVATLGEFFELEPGIYYCFNDVQPYVGLIVKSDPGLPLAALGGLMLMLGAILSLYGRSEKKHVPEQG